MICTMIVLLLAFLRGFSSIAAQPGGHQPYGYLSQQVKNSTCSAACRATNGTSLDELCVTDFNSTGLLNFGFTYLAASSGSGAGTGNSYYTCVYTHLDTPTPSQPQPASYDQYSCVCALASSAWSTATWNRASGFSTCNSNYATESDASCSDPTSARPIDRVAIISTKHFWGPDYQWGWGACQAQDSISGANVWGMYIQERTWNASSCCLACGDAWKPGQHLVPASYVNTTVSCMYPQNRNGNWRTQATTDFKCGCLDLNAESFDLDLFNGAPPVNDTLPSSASLQSYFASVNGPAPASAPAAPHKAGSSFPAAAVVVPVVVVLLAGAMLGWVGYRWRRRRRPQSRHRDTPRSPWEEPLKVQTPSLWKSLLPGKRFRTTKTTPQWATSRDSLAQNSSTRVQLDSSDNHSSTGSSSLICSIPEPVKTQEVELATGSQINSLINFEAFLAAETVQAGSSGAHSYAQESAARDKPPHTTQQVTRLVKQSLKGAVPDTWEVDLTALQLYKDAHGNPLRLGSGASGIVYKGLYRGVREVAVKVVSSPDPVAQARFVLEIATLREMRDPNIILFMGASVQPGRTLLLMQFMQHGNLWEALRRNTAGTFGWYQTGQRIVREIASGMEYLHASGYLHLDLKSPNVLLDEFDRAVVADIGLGKMANAESTVASGQTPLWASPEQRMGQPCSAASDVFSFGIVLWEVCSQEPLRNGARRELQSPQDCPQAVAALQKACCSQLTANRPSMKEVCRILASSSGSRRGFHSSASHMQPQTHAHLADQSPIADQKPSGSGSD